MKTPIKPKDIREGDLLRLESISREGRAVEYRATTAGDTDGWNCAAFKWFLLDRPTPPVSLPEEPTLGWLTYGGGKDNAFGKFRAGDVEEADHALNDDAPIAIELGASGRKVNAQFRVTAFVPATAVPTEALDKFRHLRETRNLTNGDIDAFLAAATEANR